MSLTAIRFIRNLHLTSSTLKCTLVIIRQEYQIFKRCSCIVLSCIRNNSYRHNSRCWPSSILKSNKFHIDGIITDRKFKFSSSSSRTPSSEKPSSSVSPDKGNLVPETDQVVNEKNLTLWQRFKKMYKEYWYVLVPVHLVTSFIWYGSFYYVAKSGVDIVPLLQQFGAGESITGALKNTGAGHFAIAYAMYKLATPARYTVTLGGTTLTINYLKNLGLIKPMPSRQKIKDLVQDSFHSQKRRVLKVKAKAKRKPNLKLKDENAKDDSPK